MLNNYFIIFQCITYYIPNLKNTKIILVAKYKMLVTAIEFENSPVIKGI